MNLSTVFYAHEKWAEVPGMGGAYEVSDCGRVRSKLTGKLRKPFVRKDSGYAAIHLTNGRLKRCFMIHSLVLMAHVGPRPERCVCRHLNGNRGDNRISNLAWGTHIQNSADARSHGKTIAGVKNPKAKLTIADVSEIRKSRLPYTVLARSLGVVPRTISNVKRGATWQEV